MKMMQGAFFLACSNMSRTRLAPTPTNISTKSEPEIVKNGTLASPATARAISVLPVPGGPTSSTPRGILPPSRWNFPGSRRNSTISCKSCLASSTPATSSKRSEEHTSELQSRFDFVCRLLLEKKKHKATGTTYLERWQVQRTLT